MHCGCLRSAGDAVHGEAFGASERRYKAFGRGSGLVLARRSRQGQSARRSGQAFKNMPRSKSSHRWLREHFSDPFVKKAQAEGMRSRAAYKLEEILQRDKLLRPGMTIVDLG